MKNNTKKIVFKKNLQYGLFLGVDGVKYMFNYGTGKDSGLGSLTNYSTDEEYEIIDDNHDALGNIESVIIKLNK